LAAAAALRCSHTLELCAGFVFVGIVQRFRKEKNYSLLNENVSRRRIFARFAIVWIFSVVYACLVKSLEMWKFESLKFDSRLKREIISRGVDFSASLSSSAVYTTPLTSGIIINLSVSLCLKDHLRYIHDPGGQPIQPPPPH